MFDTLARMGRRQGGKTSSTLDTLENFRVIPKSSIMKTVLLVLAATIVTIDCKKSLYDLRKRELWNPSEIIRLDKSIRGVWGFNTEYQENYNNASLFESKVELKYPTDVLYASRIELKWILATTFFEHLVANLLEFTEAVVKILGMLKMNLINRQTLELISFENDDIYSLPTFLFHAGYRKLDPIFDVIHLLRTLLLPSPANLVTDIRLRKKLQIFIREYSYIHNRKKTIEKDPKPAVVEELMKKCNKLKTELTTLSEIFVLNTTPLISTMFYDRQLEYERINRLSAFNDYIYKTEKCIIYVSITNVFRVIQFDRDFKPIYLTFY